MALECYKHKEEPNYKIPKYQNLNYIPTNDQKVNCSKDEDVCLKGYWKEPNSDPPKILTQRGCAEKEELKKNGYWKDDGSECVTTKDDYYKNATKREITACGCTTDYCNTSTFAKPSHFLPLIVLSFLKISLI